MSEKANTDTNPTGKRLRFWQAKCCVNVDALDILYTEIESKQQSSINCFMHVYKKNNVLQLHFLSSRKTFCETTEGTNKIMLPSINIAQVVSLERSLVSVSILCIA